jgi:hypothetical protein
MTLGNQSFPTLHLASHQEIERKYKNKTYLNEEYTLNFPKDLHELLRFLRNRQVKITGKKEGKTIYITLNENQNS